jgi:hypothetical protein
MTLLVEARIETADPNCGLPQLPYRTANCRRTQYVTAVTVATMRATWKIFVEIFSSPDSDRASSAPETLTRAPKPLPIKYWPRKSARSACASSQPLMEQRRVMGR